MFSQKNWQQNNILTQSGEKGKKIEAKRRPKLCEFVIQVHTPSLGKKTGHCLGAPPTEVVGHASRQFHEHREVQRVFVVS